MTILTLNLNELKVTADHTVVIDLDEVLAQQNKIGSIWGIEDVQEIRPDLNDEQAWEVLRQVDKHFDSENGISWSVIEFWADDLFDRPISGPGSEQ